MNPEAGADEHPFDPPAPDPFPWPPATGASAVQALFDTASAVLSRPASFFAAMPLGANIAPAALFLVVLTYVGAGMRLFWDMLLPPPPWSPPGMYTAGTDAAASFLIAGPVAFAMTLLGALLAHVGLIAFAARRQRPRDTLAVLCHASAANVLLIVPWLGAPLAAITGLVLSVIGLREVHRTSTARAAAAILVPLFVFAFIITFAVIALVMLGLMTGWMSR